MRYVLSNENMSRPIIESNLSLPESYKTLSVVEKKMTAICVQETIFLSMSLTLVICYSHHYIHRHSEYCAKSLDLTEYRHHINGCFFTLMLHYIVLYKPIVHGVCMSTLSPLKDTKLLSCISRSTQ